MSLIVKGVDTISIIDVVRIHEAAFKKFFLTTLGSKFLETYYKSVNNADDGILIGCYDEGKLVGFVSGSLLCAGFNKKLIKNNLITFSLVGLSLLFTNPKALLHLKKNLEKKDSDHGDDGNYVELASIGVDPNCQGQGAGTKLLKEFENYCRKKNQRVITLTTDYEDNDGVLKFYQNNGFEPWYNFVTFPNRRMYKMRKMLK